jgi:GNAT superfamily N-acetyltransferase
MEAMPLPSFPPRQGAETGAAAAGVALRPAVQDDLPRLRALYVAWRMPELLWAPWDAERKHALLHDQFALQHRHYLAHFPRADFWAAVRTADRATVGRLYLDRSLPEWCLIDILLCPTIQGQGHGSALLAWVQRSALAAEATGVRLHVGANNPRARALYLRMGFEETGGGDGLNLPMRWPAIRP